MKELKSKGIEWGICAIFVYLAGILFIDPGNVVESLLRALFLVTILALFEIGSKTDNKIIKAAYCLIYGILMAGLVALISGYLIYKVGGVEGGGWPAIVSIAVGLCGGVAAAVIQWRKHKIT